MKVLKIFMEKHNLLPEKQQLSKAMVTNNTSPANLIIARALGDFFRIFSCLVTYHTGTGPCLYMITSILFYPK